MRESHSQRTQGVVPICRPCNRCLWTRGKQIDHPLKQRKLNRRVLIRSKSRAVPVAQVLAVLVLQRLLLGKHSAEGTDPAQDLALKPAQIREIADITGREVQVSLEQGVEAGRDRREIDIVIDIGVA